MDKGSTVGMKLYIGGQEVTPEWVDQAITDYRQKITSPEFEEELKHFAEFMSTKPTSPQENQNISIQRSHIKVNTFLNSSFSLRKPFDWESILRKTHVYGFIDADPYGSFPWGTWDIPNVAKLYESKGMYMRVCVLNEEDTALVEERLSCAVSEYFSCGATVHILSEQDRIEIDLFPKSHHKYSINFKLMDITSFEGDAIVNVTAPSQCWCGEILTCVHKAGGPDLQKECMYTSLNMGDTLVTKGHKLPVKYVIHTAVPIKNGNVNKLNEYYLYRAYSQAAKIAEINGCKVIAFPYIDASYFDLSHKSAAKAIIYALRDSSYIAATICFSSQKLMDFYIRIYLLELLKELKAIFHPGRADWYEQGVLQHGYWEQISINVHIIHGFTAIEHNAHKFDRQNYDVDSVYEWLSILGNNANSLNFTGCQTYLINVWKGLYRGPKMLQEWRNGNIVQVINRACQLINETSFKSYHHYQVVFHE